MKKIIFTPEETKQVYLNLSCDYITPYYNLKERTKIPINKLRKIIKLLKEIGAIETATGWSEETGLIAGKGFASLPKHEVLEKYSKGKITERNYQRFLLLMD